MNTKKCGRETSCDIVLEHSSVSPSHADIELAEDGRVHIQDSDSDNGTHLNRNEKWIRIKRVTLCIGDRIRFGDTEVPLDQLIAVFGPDSAARLEANHFAFKSANKGNTTFAHHVNQPAILHKPRRNPVTGKIEEDLPTRVR